MNLCGVCGATNAPEARFCRSCGAKLAGAGASPAPKSAVASPPDAARAAIPDVLEELARQNQAAGIPAAAARPKANDGFEATQPLPKLTAQQLASMRDQAVSQGTGAGASNQQVGADFDKTMLMSPVQLPKPPAAKAGYESQDTIIEARVVSPVRAPAPAPAAVKSPLSPLAPAAPTAQPAKSAQPFHFQAAAAKPLAGPSSAAANSGVKPSPVPAPPAVLSAASSSSDPLAALDQALAASPPPAERPVFAPSAASQAPAPSAQASAAKPSSARARDDDDEDDVAVAATAVPAVSGKRIPPAALVAGLVALVALAGGVWYATSGPSNPKPVELPPAIVLPGAGAGASPAPVDPVAQPAPLPAPLPPPLPAPPPEPALAAPAVVAPLAPAVDQAQTPAAAASAPKAVRKRPPPPPPPPAIMAPPPPPPPPPPIAPPPPPPAPVPVPPPPRPAPKPAPPVKENFKDVYGPG